MASDSCKAENNFIVNASGFAHLKHQAIPSDFVCIFDFAAQSIYQIK